MPDRPPPRAVVGAVTGARRALLALADRLVPAQFALFDKTIGIGRTYAVGTLAELGVADLLAQRPQTADELAPQLDVDPDALHRVLRASAVEGFVKMDRRGRFRLARLGKPLRSDIPNSVRDWARYMALGSTGAAWADLTESVRTGRSAFPRVHGMSIWTWFEQHPDEERMFAGAMRWITEELAPMIVAGYDWPQGGVVCDVAGGVGTLLAAILHARPDLRGVVVDGAGVLAEADTWLSSQGLRERVELKEGNIFERVEAEADVYLLKDVLHDWDDAACARILSTVRATMPSGSKLVLVEDLQERNEPDPTASLTDIQMLTQCDDGRQRSAAELHTLLEGAGLRPGDVHRTAGPALVEGIAD
jgi:O-methyltransferase domain